MESATNGRGPPKRRVLVVTDLELLDSGLQALVAAEPKLECCGTAPCSDSALNAVAEAKPDVAIIDLSLSNGIGLDFIKRITAARAELRVLVLSPMDDALHAGRVLKAGASGYVNRRDGLAIISVALREVVAGRVYVNPTITQSMLQPTGRNGSAGAPRLSEREMQIFHLIGSGLSTKAIAAETRLSVHTVDTYRERLKGKLGALDGADLTFRAVASRLLSG